MWGYIVVGGLILANWIYHRLTDGDPGTPRPEPLQVPQVEEGTPMPLLYGTVRVRAPVMVWSGNFYVPEQEYQWVTSTRRDMQDRGQAGQATSHNYAFDGLWIVGVPFYGNSDDFNLSRIHGVRLRRAWVGDSLLAGVPGDPFPDSVPGDPFPEDAPVGSLSQRFGFAGQGIRDSGFIEPDSNVLSLSGVMYLGTSSQDVLDGALAGGPTDVARSGLVYWDGIRSGDTSLRAALRNAGEVLEFFPGFRNLVMIYAHVGLGRSSSVPSISFEVTSVAFQSASDFGHSGTQTGLEFPVLPLDEDPVAVIHDVLTSPWGKLSLPEDKIDRLSFQRVSDVLSREEHGYSMVVDRGRDASEILNDILKQIDGVMYPEPTTGKLVLRLVRADYDVASLRDINPSNARPADTSWYSIQSWSELPTQVRVKWTNRDLTSDYSEAVAVAQNGAAAVAQGRTLRSVTIQYPGCCSEALARRLASRELAALSIPMVKVSVVVNRSFHNARPGDVYTWTWPELGIDHMVMRVARVDLGQLRAGKITLDMLRDAFDVSIGAFGSGSGSGSGSGGQHE